VFVALGVQHVNRMRHIFICSQPRSTIFFSHYLINGTIFEKKLLNTKCVLIFFTTFVWNISHFKKNSARYDQNVYRSSCKVPLLFWSDVNEISNPATDFRKKNSKFSLSFIKFHENPSSGSRVVSRGRTDRHNKASQQSLSPTFRTRLKELLSWRQYNPGLLARGQSF